MRLVRSEFLSLLVGDDDLKLISSIADLHSFVRDLGSVLTAAECRTLGALWVLIAALELDTTDAERIRALLDPLEVRLQDPACHNAFIAGRTAMLFDLRSVVPTRPLADELERLAGTAFDA